MFFQMAARRDPIADLRAFLGRVNAGRDRPMTPEETRSAIAALYGIGGSGPQPGLVVSREDMDRASRARFSGPRPVPHSGASPGAGPRGASGPGQTGSAPDRGEAAAANGRGSPDNKFARFFSAQSEPISRIALRRGIDPTLLLGLSAYESAWGESRMAREQNNPFGATPGGDRSGGVRYPSIEDAWDVWDSEWGARIQDIGSDEQRFADSLLQDNRLATDGVDRRGAYNSQDHSQGGNPHWRTDILNTIRSVRRRYPEWRAAQR